MLKLSSLAVQAMTREKLRQRRTFAWIRSTYGEFLPEDCA